MGKQMTRRNLTLFEGFSCIERLTEMTSLSETLVSSNFALFPPYACTLALLFGDGPSFLSLLDLDLS